MRAMSWAIMLAGVCLLPACGTDAAESQETRDPGTADAWLSATTDRPEVQRTLESLNSPDGIVVAAGEFVLRLTGTDCDTFADGFLLCENETRVDVSTPNGVPLQTLSIASMVLKADSMTYRGPLNTNDRPDAHSFVVSDLNADGHEDLMIWSGREGAYGGPSFDVYLFDVNQRKLRFNQALSDLTIGYIGLFDVDGRIITTNAESGCCIQIRETHVIDGDAPKLVERVTINHTMQGAPIIITERVVDGKLQVVRNALHRETQQ